MLTVVKNISVTCVLIRDAAQDDRLSSA